nr:TdeIII family type II restriction endonuclease [candidate division KSB1 bacterium]
MALAKEQIRSVEDTIRNSLRNRFETYNPEPAVMPFHTRLLGKDRLALYAFIHSLNTNFGSTIFEPVAVSLASSRFKIAKHQIKSGTQISTMAQFEIQKIMDELTAANIEPDKQKEIEIIRRVCQKGEIRTVKPTRVDVYLESSDREIY